MNHREKTGLLWLVAALALLLLLGAFGMGGLGIGMMGFGMGFGFLFMILFWGAVIWLAVMLVNSTQAGEKEGGAEAVLKKRYASGEISRKQYMEMRKEIGR